MDGVLYIDDDGGVKISEYGLSLEPLANLWRRDTSKHKERAYKEISFIVFPTSMSRKNPYREYPKKERIDALNKDIFNGEADLGDALLADAIKFVVERTRSLSKEHLSNAIEALNNIGKYIKSVDLTATDDSGKPIYNVKQYQEVAQRTAKDVQNLIELRKLVDAEDSDKSTIRAGGEQELDI